MYNQTAIILGFILYSINEVNIEFLKKKYSKKKIIKTKIFNN